MRSPPNMERQPRSNRVPSRAADSGDIVNPQTQTVPTSQYPQMGQLPPGLSNLATAGTNWLQGQIGQQAPGYQQAMAAPLSSGQVAQIAGASQLAGPWMGTAAPAAQTVNQFLQGGLNPYTGTAAQTPQAITDILGGSTMPGQSPYIQGVLGQLGQQEAQDIQNIRSTYGMGPGVNAALGQMQGNIMANYANQAMAQLLNQQNVAAGQQLQAAPIQIGQQQVPYQAYQQMQANQLAALSPAMQMPQQALAQLGGAGGTQQQAMQNYLTAAYQDWLRQQGGPWQAAATALPLLVLE